MTVYGKDEYIGKSIYNYGEWSGLECDKLLELSKGGVFVDCGANVGYMSLALSTKASKVVAFEPQPAIFELLKANVPSAEAYCMALYNDEGVAKMPRIRYGDRGNYGGVGFGRSELGFINVPLVTLDSFGLRDVDLIKIDVEGAERDVIEGAIETIERCSPILYVEDDREDKSADLRKLIRGLGYNIEEHNPPMFRQNNYKGLQRNIWDKHYISKNLICWK
jgi:FkbM family methyltransferase